MNKTLKKSRVLTGSVTRVSYALPSVIFIVGSGLLLALSLAGTSNFNGVKLKIVDLAAPVISKVQAPINYSSAFIRDLTGLAQLQEDNARLAQENTKLKEWYLLAQNLQNENAEFRNLLNVENTFSKQFVTAKILSDVSSPYAKSVLVDLAGKTEIHKNAPVVSAQGVVGRIINVGDNVARVLLLTDVNSRVPVMVKSGNAMVHAIAAGENKDQLSILHMSEGRQINDGTTIFTSGLGGIYPKGMAVGVVRSLGSKKPYIQPYMDVSSTAFVRIFFDKPLHISSLKK